MERHENAPVAGLDRGYGECPLCDELHELLAVSPHTDPLCATCAEDTGLVRPCEGCGALHYVGNLAEVLPGVWLCDLCEHEGEERRDTERCLTGWLRREENGLS